MISVELSGIMSEMIELGVDDDLEEGGMVSALRFKRGDGPVCRWL